MRWLSRRTPQAAPRGRHAAGQQTAPKTVVLPVVVPDPAPTVEATPEATPEWAPEPLPSPIPLLPTGSGVHLGFADGSEHELTPGDPRVGAFRAVARTLVGV